MPASSIKCGNYGRYQAKLPPRCQGGSGCPACWAKYRAAHPDGPPRPDAPSAATDPISPIAVLQAQHRDLLREVSRLRESALTDERVRQEILTLSQSCSTPPDWLTPTTPDPTCYGVPTLFVSDQHLGEVVRAEEIGGVNRYDLEIAKKRWRRCVEKSIHLCHYLHCPQFDGVVLALGGDGVSGEIHEELADTNEAKTAPLTLDLADLIIWTVRELKRAFGKVFIPCVIGNHGRMSHKPRAKRAAHTSFDWLAYQISSRPFEGDPAVQFLISPSEDVSWRVYEHRYTLTHGAQFRGGDGIIGPIGPIFRGDQKKRSRNAQVGASYDTLLIAHFHQLAMERRIVRNGSLKGYDEYAFRGNFPFEPPLQALWITHPKYGMTYSVPVYCDDPPAPSDQPWVSWRE